MLSIGMMVLLVIQLVNAFGLLGIIFACLGAMCYIFMLDGILTKAWKKPPP